MLPLRCDTAYHGVMVREGPERDNFFRTSVIRIQTTVWRIQ